MEINLTVNGESRSGACEPRKLLVHFVRENLGLTGAHVGCVSGRCGCCTMILDDQPVKACIVLAAQANGRSLRTVEGLADGPDQLSPMQEAFWAADAAECGFCTPGMLMACQSLLDRVPHADEEEIKEAIGGNLCRCTGYANIVKAVRMAQEAVSE